MRTDKNKSIFSLEELKKSKAIGIYKLAYHPNSATRLIIDYQLYNDCPIHIICEPGWATIDAGCPGWNDVKWIKCNRKEKVIISNVMTSII